MTLLRCAEILLMIFSSHETLNAARFSPRYFTRIRKMSFQDILCYLISGCKGTTQAVLNNFFHHTSKSEHMTQQALSKARSHFDHTPFLKAFYALRDEEYNYKKEENLKRLHGMLFIAIDGSIIPLPNYSELRSEFGALNGSPSARASIALDVINDRIVDASLSPLSVDERTLAKEHVEKICKIISAKKIVFVFDRGYPSAELISYLMSNNTNCIMRVKRKFSESVDRAGIGSTLLRIEEGITIRVIKLYLPSGEVETLITNLYKVSESRFKKLYFMRWPVETKYDLVKNKLELPNFTGYSKNIIYQDFWISMLLSNIASIAKAEADRNIGMRSSTKCKKYKYQANMNVVIASLRDRFAAAVFSKNPILRRIRVNKIIYEISCSAVPVRPDRDVSRNEPRKVKYHHNKKSNV